MAETNLWKSLGAFSVTLDNVPKEMIADFAKIGGKWIVPVIYGDDSTGPTNLAQFKRFREWCKPHGIVVGGWFNCWGGDPQVDAKRIATICLEYEIKYVILDLEAAYQYPGGNPNAMPQLVATLRALLPQHDIGVSTNGMNNSMIWNGRVLPKPLSFYDLGIRVLPQWYSWMWQSHSNTRPDVNMAWLESNGNTDFNFVDLNAVKTKRRGVPLSYVHGTLETTGLENASLVEAIDFTLAAKKYHGYTTGISIYTLENMPESDYKVLVAQRGVLYAG